MKKESPNGNGNGKKPKKEVIKEFDFGDTKTAKSLIKVLKMTRLSLYPEHYDEKGNLRTECVK